MEHYKILEPDTSKIDIKGLYEKYINNKIGVADYTHSITYPKYLPWEKARFKDVPQSFTKEEAWFLARDFRTANAKRTPIKDPSGRYFSWTRLDYTDQMLNYFDMYMGGHFMTAQPKLSSSEQQKFMSRGIIEEAIASSQLEGASVTRKIAREMIIENRSPRTTSEHMIINNFNMMNKLTNVYQDVPMSRELLLEMHQILAKDTMPLDEIGRFRRDSDNIEVGTDNVTYHVPPRQKFLEGGLDDMITFANDNSEENFVHPVIKAIMLHFWVGFLHPFTDGNGRIARALFYWILLKNNYWLATYIPISTVIKRAPAQYGFAFVYSEQDNLDFTYFYDYHMKKIKKALDEFISYVDAQRIENQQIDMLLDSAGKLNDRQKQVMHYLLANQRHYVTVSSHAALNRINRNTASSDLDELLSMKVVFPVRSGKFIRYFAKPLDSKHA